MEETAFGIGAFCVVAAIVGGGLKAAKLWEVPVITPCRGRSCSGSSARR